MHVPGADRTDQCFAAPLTQREHKKDMAPSYRDADRLEPLLLPRMRRVRKDSDRLSEQRLDIGDGHAVLAALPAVAVIPIEAGNLDIHARQMSVVHTFVNI